MALVVVWEFLYFKKIQAEFNKIDDADLTLKEIISNNNPSIKKFKFWARNNIHRASYNDR